MNKIFTLFCASFLYVQVTVPGGDPFDVLQKMAALAGKTELTFTRGMPRETFNSQFKLLVTYYHPDKPTGSTELMKQLNDAHEKALAVFGPEKAPKRELTPTEQKVAAFWEAAKKAATEASTAIEIKDFATAASRYKDAGLQFDELVKTGVVKYKTCPEFMKKMAAAVAELPDVQKKISVITDDLENGKLTPSADVVGKGHMATFKKDSDSQKTEATIKILLKQLKDRKEELTRETPKVFTHFDITAFDKLIDDLSALQSAITTEKRAEGRLRNPALVDALLFLDAKTHYDKLHLINCAQRMAEKAAYAQALQAENTAIGIATGWQGLVPDRDAKYKRYLEDKGESWKLAANAWQKAAEATNDPRLKFAYEQRARDVANPKMRTEFTNRTYKMKEPPASK